MKRYIDINAAIKRFEELHGEENTLVNCYNADWIISFLETLPAADVAKIKHEQWQKYYKSGTTVSEGFVSSCCDMWNERKTPYCPNCGAKMDGGKV